VFLAASESRWLRERAVKVPFVRRAVRKFMPGETIDDALTASRELGVGTVLTRLGENLKSAGEAEGVARHYLEVLDRVAAEKLDVEISVKLTQLGLDFSREECERHLHELAERARSHGNWLWVDMESTAYTDVTLDIYRRLRGTFPNTGLCVQSYLYRTAADVESLVSLGSGIRLVKGAYAEPATIAYQRRQEVDSNFVALAVSLLEAVRAGRNVRVGLGTHDVRLIEQIAEHAAAMGLPKTSFEIEMLYGIRMDQQRRLAGEGYLVRDLIAYGEAWYPWYMRRLAERPANVIFALRQIIG